MADQDCLAKAFKQAAQRLHPDTLSGSHEAFVKLENARKILEKSFI
jgi:DnaJ-class molecular chaperone